MATEQNLNVFIKADASGVKTGVSDAKQNIQDANTAITESAKKVSEATKEAAAQVAAANAKMAAATSTSHHGIAASLKETTSKMGDSVKGMTEGMKSGLNSLTNVVGAVQKHFVVLAALVAGAGVFKESIEETQKFTGEAIKLSKALGITTAEAAALNVALGDIYSDSETLVSASSMLTKQLRTNEDALNGMGLVTRDANGEYRNMKDLMMDSISVLKEYKEGTDRNLAAQTLFGKGAGDVNSLMRLNAEVIEAAKEKQEQLGLIVGNENVEANKRYKAAMNDVGDVMTAIKKVIGDAVMPVFTKLGEWFAEIGPSAVVILKGAIGGLTAVFWALKNGVVVVWETINAMVVTVAEPIRALASAIGKALQGDWAGAKAEIMGVGDVISGAWGGAMSEIYKSSEETSTRIGELFNKPLASTAGGSKEGKSYIDPKEKEKQPKDTTDPVMKGFDAELSELKLAYQEKQRMEGSWREFSKEQEVEFWQVKNKLVEAGSNEEKTIRKKVADLKLALDKESFLAEIEADRVKVAGFEKNAEKKLEIETKLLERLKLSYGEDSKEYQTQLRTKLQAEQQAVEQRNRMADAVAAQVSSVRIAAIEEERLDAQMKVQLGLMTGLQMIEQERGFEDRINAIKREALVARKADLDKDPDKNPEERLKVNLQIEELEQQHQRKLSEMRHKATVEDTARWRGTMTAIQQGFAQTFAQVMKGQMTLSQAVKSMFQTIVGAVINMLAEMAAKWLVTKVLEIAWGKTAAMSNVKSHAAEAGAAGVASWAAAPWPINLGAPAFGASMFAAAEAFGAAAAAPGFAVGAWEIPDDGITKVHKGETILNASDAENFRNAREGLGSNGEVHLHIAAFDGRDVRRVFMDNGGSIVKSVQQQARNFRGLSNR